MKLYNTLSRNYESVARQSPQPITMYTCGPTVYNHIHIGNLSSFIFSDMLRRVLQSEGSEVRHVMNLTDVDDKTIGRSAQKYGEMPPMQALLKLTSEYTELFMADMGAAGNDLAALTFISATGSIKAMQELICHLHQQGFAYVADDGVYFSIKAYKKSGKKYGRLTAITASSTSEARIKNDEYDKEAAHDFALWKAQKDDEPAWDFELGGHDLKGRPGWHIECSAMSRLLLGQPFDIHTGGVDLLFPHHENEIAQSTAGDDTEYARIFAHNEHLLIDGQKMSKSLGNFYTLEDIVDKGFDPLAFRLLVLQAHYRKQAHFSWDNLESAQNRLNSYRAMADQYWQPRLGQTNKLPGITVDTLDAGLAAIARALQDDLDTPAALAGLSALESAIGVEGVSIDCQEAYGEALSWLDSVLGLGLKAPDISDEQKQLVFARQQARQAGDWVQSDKLRDGLSKQGIGVRDTEHGPVWARIKRP